MIIATLNFIALLRTISQEVAFRLTQTRESVSSKNKFTFNQTFCDSAAAKRPFLELID